MRTHHGFHLTPHSSPITIFFFLFALHSSLLTFCAFSQFEGVVQSRSTFVDDMGNQASSTMTMSIAKEMLRIENSAVGETPASTMIYRGDKKVMWILSDEEKIYFEIPQREESNPARSPQAGAKPQVHKTGKTKTVAGYRCEQLLVSEGETETEIWAAKGLTALARAINKGIGADAERGAGDWNDEIFSMGLMPLLSSTKMEGKVIESQEIVKIEIRSVAKDKFEVPPGYKKESVGGMMNKQ